MTIGRSRTTRGLRKTVSQAKWRVSLDVVFIGKFKTDGRYGHMDMYPLSIEVYKVEAATASKTPEHSPSPSMRRPVDVKAHVHLLLSVNQFPFSQAAPVAILPFALFVSDLRSVQGGCSRSVGAAT